MRFTLVGEKQECDSDELGGYVKTLHQCALNCQGISSMFAYGTDDFLDQGKKKCSEKGCPCLCETIAKQDGTCDVIENKGYRLYKYAEGELG